MPSFLIHIVSNIILAYAIFLYNKKVKRRINFKLILFVILASNAIDMDHLLANPIYDPERCSINFHPLHSWYFFPIYLFGSFMKKYRYFFWGIDIHIILDFLDCFI
ncbi:hypothetical protein ISS07_04740 [Candidatus Woesearchaeota archaeon]|nr:hypothetical protein [Candidatus Woesearchaeota archaeon]